MIKNFKNKVVLITIGFVFGTGFFTMIYFFSLSETNKSNYTSSSNKSEIIGSQNNSVEQCIIVNKEPETEDDDFLYINCSGFY